MLRGIPKHVTRREIHKFMRELVLHHTDFKNRPQEEIRSDPFANDPVAFVTIHYEVNPGARASHLAASPA